MASASGSRPAALERTWFPQLGCHPRRSLPSIAIARTRSEANMSCRLCIHSSLREGSQGQAGEDLLRERAGKDATSSTSSTANSPTRLAGKSGDSSHSGQELSRQKVNIFDNVGDNVSPSQRTWELMVRWGRALKQQEDSEKLLSGVNKIVVFGGGSFATAMASLLATNRPGLSVVLLLRDAALCSDINTKRVNTRYLPEFTVPPGVSASTDPAEAIPGAQVAVHAVPVQHSRVFLQGIAPLLAPDVPVVCLSKGLEVDTGLTMAEVIPQALQRQQPCAFLSGPSFAREVMEGRPTALAVASSEARLNKLVQQLFSSQHMRVSSTPDVTGVEIAGALKNVLAIGAGIVDGMGLGLNATAAVIAQGTSEIRWLAERMGANPATVAGVSGLGDIMLTCYGSLSRNRTVGVRLGQGERLEDILASTSQVAEGVATARVVARLAYQYRVQLPVLTAVAQILEGHVTPREAVLAIMELPQMELH